MRVDPTSAKPKVLKVIGLWVVYLHGKTRWFGDWESAIRFAAGVWGLKD